MSDEKPGPEYYYGPNVKHHPSPAEEGLTMPDEDPIVRAARTLRFNPDHLPIGHFPTRTLPRSRYYQTQEPTKRGPLAFPVTLVAPGERISIYTQPFTSFRPEFLAVGKIFANDFEILDLKAGNMTYISGAYPVPAEHFVVDSVADLKETAFSQYSRWDMAAVNPSQTIQLVVRNRGAVLTCEFVACLFGVWLP